MAEQTELAAQNMGVYDHNGVRVEYFPDTGTVEIWEEGPVATWTRVWTTDGLLADPEQNVVLSPEVSTTILRLGRDLHAARTERDTLQAELDLLHPRLSASDGAEAEWHNLATKGVTAAAKWKGERDEARGKLDQVRAVLASWYPDGPPVPREVLNEIRAIVDCELTTRCVNDTNGDGDCAACSRNPDAPCRQPIEAQP